MSSGITKFSGTGFVSNALNIIALGGGQITYYDPSVLQNPIRAKTNSIIDCIDGMLGGTVKFDQLKIENALRFYDSNNIYRGAVSYNKNLTPDMSDIGLVNIISGMSLYITESSRAYFQRQGAEVFSLDGITGVLSVGSISPLSGSFLVKTGSYGYGLIITPHNEATPTKAYIVPQNGSVSIYAYNGSVYQDINFPYGNIKMGGNTVVNSSREAIFTNLTVDNININGSTSTYSNNVHNNQLLNTAGYGHIFGNTASGRKAAVTALSLSDTIGVVYSTDYNNVANYNDLMLGHHSGSYSNIYIDIDGAIKLSPVSGSVVDADKTAVRACFREKFNSVISAANYDIQDTDGLIITSSSSNVVDLDLQEASTRLGQKHTINTANSANYTTITCDGTGDYIYVNGTAYTTCTLTGATKYVKLQAMNGNQWEAYSYSETGVTFS